MIALGPDMLLLFCFPEHHDTFACFSTHVMLLPDA